MPVSEATLTETLRGSALAPTHVAVTDQSNGCGQAYAVVVVSPAFRNMKTLERHRAVNTAVGPLIAELHAFSQKAWTPEEWAAKQSGPSQPA
ncbi:hypothetical protein CXG81DRAFT_15893 [Caulochytrium protostelioides]|uniref:Bola-like protein n=1 Tax=Caulochytrium protostelioides TaxID=1555241 RepID=A0A4P9X0G7_9FUNG|nr:bola-like protein [Caulochytrium protostelioides]RKO98462.1 hypothetical protein CXG81DRAFT_15893 [Caulochytrium protostelioides]|eukprot:RKO98462.1 hypothetical protein CXG81DRAFT_15893 [Caulochytrium protostelioides]